MVEDISMTLSGTDKKRAGFRISCFEILVEPALSVFFYGEGFLESKNLFFGGTFIQHKLDVSGVVGDISGGV